MRPDRRRAQDLAEQDIRDTWELLEELVGQAAVHLAAHREHPPAARVRQAGRTEPGRARRRGTSLDRVMSSPLAASTIDRVQSVGFAVRLLPGQAEAHRIALASCWSGARKEAYQDARRRAGIIREAVWIQPGPGGDVAVVYLEADDLATAFTIVGTSAEPFDRWFRSHARQVHGIALGEGFTAPELVLDFDTSRI